MEQNMPQWDQNTFFTGLNIFLKSLRSFISVLEIVLEFSFVCVPLPNVLHPNIFSLAGLGCLLLAPDQSWQELNSATLTPM